MGRLLDKAWDNRAEVLDKARDNRAEELVKAIRATRVWRGGVDR